MGLTQKRLKDAADMMAAAGFLKKYKKDIYALTDAYRRQQVAIKEEDSENKLDQKIKLK